MTRLQHNRRAREAVALLLALMLSAGSAASTSAAAAEPQRTRTFDIRVGQTVSLAGYRMRVTLARVAEDSRCPEGVQCVWQGNVRLALRLTSPGFRSRAVSLNTANEPTRVSYRGNTLRIVSVRPPKREGQNIPQRRYRVTLEVSR